MSIEVNNFFSSSASVVDWQSQFARPSISFPFLFFLLFLNLFAGCCVREKNTSMDTRLLERFHLRRDFQGRRRRRKKNVEEWRERMSLDSIFQYRINRSFFFFPSILRRRRCDQDMSSDDFSLSFQLHRSCHRITPAVQLLLLRQWIRFIPFYQLDQIFLRALMISHFFLPPCPNEAIDQQANIPNSNHR